MKLKTTAICCIQLAIVIALACTTVTGAAATQWFPADGTNCDYGISVHISYNNNTSSTLTTFDVYKDSSNLYVTPSIFHITSGSWILIKNNTQVLWRHSYKSISATQLNRTAGIVVGGTFYTDPVIYIYTIAGVAFPRYTTELTMQKDNYYTGVLDHIFPDYINCTARIGEQLNPGFSILTNDGTQMILSYNLTIPSPAEYYTITGFADNTGRMTKWVVADWSPTAFGGYNAHDGAVAFTVASSGSSVPGFPIWIVFSAMAIALIPLLVAGRKKFRN
ncbi:MAG TPA: hypothetical protein VKM55_16160 [Candidatus Lokiarchaeia archaeon]|nr:hypothetical protein [Candidatus Lokiarchaeia archaeon]